MPRRAPRKHDFLTDRMPRQGASCSRGSVPAPPAAAAGSGLFCSVLPGNHCININRNDILVFFCFDFLLLRSHQCLDAQADLPALFVKINNLGRNKKI